VESAVGDLKRALEGGDVTAIQTAHDALSRTSQKLGEAMYATAQAAAGTGAPGGFGEGANPSSDDEVVDAEIVDEPKREGGSA
jgi:molecular chaperone DnaK